jgi:hypothetical protein
MNPTGANLGTSLSQRCLELSNLIKEKFSNNMSRGVLIQFKPVVESIFGVDTSTEQGFSHTEHNKQSQSQGWMLRTLTRSSNPSDYDAVVSFLHPDGIFFALIKSLMTETSAKYEFPVTQFPPCFRFMIENGTAPPFYANKILTNNYTSVSHLILNAFEYYIFHFGLYILNNNSSVELSTLLTNEPAYFTLLKIYLDYFVPIENVPRTTDGLNYLSSGVNQQSSLWQSLSSKTSSILNMATNNVRQTNSSQSPPSLFKASIFHASAPFNQSFSNSQISTPGPLLYNQGEHLGSVEWRCSTFLLMLTELWFGNIPAPKTNYILRAVTADDLSVTEAQPYSANIDQMTAVRIVIKHLHSFSNSFTYSPISHINNQGLAEIKQAIWTVKYPLQKRLYNFIKVAFNRWPLDYTFRQPLEAWLSYIQPWRYVKISNNEYNSDLEDLEGNSRSNTLIDVPSIDNHWKNFISDNLLYYTVIFSLLIDRLLNLDLSSSRNALMLFRVIKVYSQPGFLVLLKEAEDGAVRNNLDQTHNLSVAKSPHVMSTPNKSASDLSTSKARLLAPSFLNGRTSTPKVKVGSLEPKLPSLESDSHFNYVSLFSQQSKEKLQKLLVEAQKSRLSIKDFILQVEHRSMSRNRSWFDSIRAVLTMEDTCFESKDEREMYKDKIQAEEYLNFAINKITQCFDVQMPEIDMSDRSTTNLTTSQRVFFNV